MALGVAPADLARMREQLFFDGEAAGAKLSRFWVLLTLAAVIAGSGVVADSTATVIGAMIVAPLMTPILGTVLAVVTGDGPNLARSLLLVVTGAALVIAIGWLFAALVPEPVVASTNSQVSGRVHPQMIDLIGALATGAVGSFALVRSDISDTLPGVAIAISLVPPLVVVGLTLQAGAGSQAAGALVLFLTNVGAILLSGLAVMALYRVFALAEPERGGVHRRTAIGVIVVFAVLVAVPLAVSTVQVVGDAVDRGDVEPVADRWAAAAGWQILGVKSGGDGTEVRAGGPLPGPDPAALRAALVKAGHGDLDVIVDLVPARQVELGR
jgi:uncharacterized hydrophobic protein (TIGR00271 family)